MYLLASQLKGLSIVSLQSGDTIGSLRELILSPDSLELLALDCEVPGRTDHPVLMSRDVRQIAADCIIIDDEDEITAAEDIVRLQEHLKSPFSPLGLKVITDMQRQLGKVEDFTLNIETMRLQKLYIKLPLWRSWIGSSLIIDRDQILDVTPRHIVVREAVNGQPKVVPEAVPEHLT